MSLSTFAPDLHLFTGTAVIKGEENWRVWKSEEDGSSLNG